MNKDRKNYIYNPKEFRAKRPAKEQPGQTGFVTGLVIGVIIGIMLARYYL